MQPSQNLPPSLRLRHLWPEADQEAAAKVSQSTNLPFKSQYRNDPVAFVSDCIDWKDDHPAKYQLEIIGELPIKKRVTVRGPHGLGKSALASWIVLWFALTRDGEDWKCPTTASVWRQLSKFLWPEIHKWSRRVKWDKIGRPSLDSRSELLQLNLKLGTGEAFAVASDNHESIEGAHADSLLYLFDEAKAIPVNTFDAAEGAFSGAGSTEAFALAISTPGEPIGRFYDIHSRKSGYSDWWVRHVTLQEAIDAGRISREWADQRKAQWGEQSAIYQNRVEGEFCASDEDGIIPLGWVEAANRRWEEWNDSRNGDAVPITHIGVDVARSGEDKTVQALRSAKVLTELRRSSKEDTMQTSGRVLGVLRKHPTAKAIVDVIGIGAGVVDRLREEKFKVTAFNAGERTDKTDKSGEMQLVNKKSAAWWNLRELLDPANGEDVALLPDDLLTGDLTAPHWRTISSGKIQVEGKDDTWANERGQTLRQRLGRSTDDGDATAMAFWEEKKEVKIIAPFGMTKTSQWK